MADTFVFFNEILPAKIAADEELRSLGVVYQFDIEGAGTWTVDLKDGTIKEGPVEAPDCLIQINKEDWEQVVDSPMLATQLFMMGRIKTTALGLAIQLQKILA